MDLKARFQEFIKDKYLFSMEQKILVAVSGGVDSVVLCHLLNACNYPFSIAHCNFQLRGNESNEDENFVIELAKNMRVECHLKRFNTEGYVSEKKVSTQVAARELRYEWFEKLRQNLDYQCIVTAHHASDNIETVLYHFAKGTGLRGLGGMKPQNNALIRPLLWAKKEEILAYSQTHNLAFREDSSNESDKYARNYTRHHIVPAFQNINPSFEKTAIENINRLAETQVLLDFFIKKIKPQIIKPVENQFFINIKKLKSYPSVSTLLFELLKDFGFNNAQVEQILQNDRYHTGAMFHSKTHILLIDRFNYIVAKQKTDNTEAASFLISEADKCVETSRFQLTFYSDVDCPKSFSENPHSVFLDGNKLVFPLILRKYQEGDRFQPLGMNGKSQLLSDFLRLKKLSQFEKEQVWILETAEKEICWVVGFRLDERFKIKEGVQSCLQIELNFQGKIN